MKALPTLRTIFQASVGSLYNIMGYEAHPATEVAGHLYDQTKLKLQVALQR